MAVSDIYGDVLMDMLHVVISLKFGSIIFENSKIYQPKKRSTNKNKMVGNYGGRDL